MTTEPDEKDLASTPPIIGTCETMCPTAEIKMREEKRLLHKYEVVRGTEKERKPVADSKRAVKCYARCAAGQAFPKLCDLRPPDVLEKTFLYLVTNILHTKEQTEWPTVYNFICDRLLAIRQDITIQRIENDISLKIYEYAVRFYAYSLFRCHGLPLNDYDPHINRSELRVTLEKVLQMYDKGFDSDSIEEMEAIYVIVNLGKLQSFVRGGNLVFSTKDVHAYPCLQLAMRCSQFRYHNNYTQLRRLLQHLPLVLQCIAFDHMPSVRHSALKCMCSAYSSPNSKFPLNKLKDILLYADNEEAKEDCAKCGIAVEDEYVLFRRKSFLDDVKLGPIQPLEFMVSAFSTLSVADFILHGSMNGECLDPVDYLLFDQAGSQH